jgi:hypothetical protein
LRPEIEEVEDRLPVHLVKYEECLFELWVKMRFEVLLVVIN